MKPLLFTMAGVWLLLSCGREAPPVAKDRLLPPPPLIKKVIFRDGILILFGEMRNKLYLSHLSAFNRCTGREEKMEPSGTEKFIFTIPVEPGCGIFFSTKNRYNKGNGIWIEVPSEIPLPQPPDFSLSRFSGRVEVNLSREMKVNIYRSPGHELIPVNEKPLSGTVFIDYSVESDREYSYSLRGVVEAGNLEIEGGASQWKKVPPAYAILLPPPEEVRITKKGKEILVEWTPVPSEELLGYNIYVVSGKLTMKITETPVKDNLYILKPPAFRTGAIARIGVSSVNRAGREGEIRWVKPR